MITLKIKHIVAALLGTMVVASSWAQGFPTKPVRIVVPFPPGGSTDAGARILAAKLTEDFKQTVFVENRPGAGTTIGAAYVAASPADGYTLYVTGPITHASSQALYKKLPYDAIKSFAPVGMMTTSPFIIVVHPHSQSQTLRQLLDAARANPGKLTYASSGNGAAPHLATEIIAKATGTTFTHVPYKGVGPALVALLGEQVDFMIADVAVVPQLREGRLRALALTTEKESYLVPGVPSISEAGVPGVDIPSALAMLAPANTPRDVIERINVAMNKALADPDTKKKLALQGFETAPGTPEVLSRFLASEVQRYGKIVQDSGIQID